MTKSQFSKTIRLLCALCLPVWAVTPRLLAQTQAGLDIRLYPGLSLTGAVGTVYAIQYARDLAQTNAWRTTTFVQLTTRMYLWTDTSPASAVQGFYRAVPMMVSNLVFIPPGTFRMGSPLNEVDRVDDEGPQTVVTLTKGFFMGK